jgi:hypothetical protein
MSDFPSTDLACIRQLNFTFVFRHLANAQTTYQGPHGAPGKPLVDFLQTLMTSWRRVTAATMAADEVDDNDGNKRTSFSSFL